MKVNKRILGFFAFFLCNMLTVFAQFEGGDDGETPPAPSPGAQAKISIDQYELFMVVIAIAVGIAFTLYRLRANKIIR